MLGCTVPGLTADRRNGPPDSLHPINPPTLQFLQFLQLTRGPPQQGKPRNRKAPASRLQTLMRIDLPDAYTQCDLARAEV
jgi:hypothetical protein